MAAAAVSRADITTWLTTAPGEHEAAKAHSGPDGSKMFADQLATAFAGAGAEPARELLHDLEDGIQQDCRKTRVSPPLAPLWGALTRLPTSMSASIATRPGAEHGEQVF